MDQGGGIWNGSLDPSSSLGPLRLIDSTVTRNVLKVSAGVTARGGGVFTIAKPSIRGTTIAHNRPTNAKDADALPARREPERLGREPRTLANYPMLIRSTCTLPP
jgi:hypothetical protein